MAKATIFFAAMEPTERNLQPNATTDDDGKYSLTTYLSGDGAPAGEYIVVVTWPGPPTGRKAKAPDPGSDPEEDTLKDYLKGKYFSVTVSKLRATVKAEPANEIDFKFP